MKTVFAATLVALLGLAVPPSSADVLEDFKEHVSNNWDQSKRAFTDGDWTLYLPLWPPFFLFLIPGGLLWLRDHRDPRPGFCSVCDYDLTGNTSGRCPECGTPCERASEKALPPAA